jgi:predicted ATPase
LLERTEGYPFYIEETVQGLVEEGVLTGERGSYRLTVPVREISVPPTIQSVIGARIDRLPPDSKRLLQIASVIGKDFELALLRSVAEADDAGVQNHLAIIQDGEFVYETHLFPDLEYTFKHALTHQVAYEGLLKQHRREKHAKILTAMERNFADRLQERFERKVHHGLRGECWELVHRYGMAAGHRALKMNASRSAVEAFENAAKAWRHLPETPENIRDAIDCRFEIRDALRLAAKLDDQRQLIEIILYQSGNEWADGKNRSAMKLAQEARILAEQSGDAEFMGLADYRIFSAALLMGDYATAAETGVAGTKLLQPFASSLIRFGGLVQIFIGSFSAVALAELGRFDEAVAVGRAAFNAATARLQHQCQLFRHWSCPGASWRYRRGFGTA